MLKRLFAGLLLLALALAVAILWDAKVALTQPLGGAPGTVLVERGNSFRAVVATLQQRQVFAADHHRYYFMAYARARGMASRIKSGEFVLEPGMTLPQLLTAMVQGRQKQHRLTVVEGSTFAQLRAALEAHEAIDNSLTGKTDTQVMLAIGADDQHPEGRFMPDTYHFHRGFTDQAFLRRAYLAMQDYLDRAWTARQPDLPYTTPYQALIMASIIEKETAVEAERRRISGVFVRRLRVNMPLQTDPVVIYGIDDFDGDIRRSDLRRDGPYNSYRRRGLPPTPIALPGRDSIDAAVDPADGTALYFVSKGDGSHQFSDTLAEHNRAVRRYQLNQP